MITKGECINPVTEAIEHDPIAKIKSLIKKGAKFNVYPEDQEPVKRT